MKRRKFIAVSGTGVMATLAGCIPDAERVQELPRPTTGVEDSGVTVQAFEDFSCPACAAYEENVFSLIKEQYVDNGDISYEHYDYAIPVHPRWSFEVANAARSVQDSLGDEEFFEYKKLMFDNQDIYNRDLLVREAENVGIEDTDTFRSNLSSSLYRPVIESDTDTGEDMGVQGTPAVFVNGELVSKPDFETISMAIDEELDS